MSEPTIQPPSGAKCEACGCWCTTEITRINVKNGHLWLCFECLDEINRKSQLLRAAEASLATVQSERDTLIRNWAHDQCDMERALNVVLGLPVDADGNVVGHSLAEMIDLVPAAVEAARREEREACAKVAEQKRLLWNADMIAAAIRSRTTEANL